MGGELLKAQPDFGPSIVTALAHLGGRNVAIVANDPSRLAGTIDRDAADKTAPNTTSWKMRQRRR